MVGTVFFCQIGFFRTTDAGNHPGAQRLGDLDGCDADAARSTVDQHGFARLVLSAFDQSKVGGGVGDAHCGGIGEAHRIRHRVTIVLRYYAFLGVSAVFVLRGDAVAGFAGSDAGADRSDYARHILARAERSLGQNLVGAADHQQVRKVDACGMYVDQHLAWTRCRIRHFFQQQVFDRSVLSDDQGFHRRRSCLNDFSRRDCNAAFAVRMGAVTGTRCSQ